MEDFNRKTDEELVALSKAGENAATELLLRRYMSMVRARARRYFLEGGDTDDLMQEGMIGLYNAIGAYNEKLGKSFKNYAYLCVTGNIVDAVRRSLRKKNGPLNQSLSLSDPELSGKAEGETPEDFLLDTEADAEFHRMLMNELSDFEFHVVAMYLEGISYASICEATKKDFKSVDNALARAKRKLQKLYSESGEKKG